MNRTALVDLHLHLDGSLDLPWAYEESIKAGIIDENCSYEDYYRIVYQTKYKNREDGFRKFALMCGVLQTRENLFQAAYNLVRRLNEKGMIYAEIRFASQQHIDKGLSQLEALQAVIDGARKGMEDFPDIKVGIINCLMHKGENAAFNWRLNEETVYVSKEMLGKGLVGIDLAGYENNGDFRDYGPLFKLAKQLGIPYTIHAGEMGIGEHVLYALDMQPNRIGHGIDCVQDDRILNEVVRTQIPLEVCVTSNCRHDVLYVDHPIRKLLEKGVYVTLNCDNMTFSRTDMANEHSQLRLLGVSIEDLQKCTLRAIEAAFCSDEDKKELREKALKIMGCGE
ncbi:MAG: adenosine deaminase family protein [Erysipelotrichaceae bacterium]|nr:adenosine deaminase family protein [Erysipelotrichaceae bacterium]